VQAGENLFRLALRYGVTVDDLKAANGLTSDLIDVGQVLVIPVGARPTLAPQVTSPGDVLPPTPPSS
jgi:LysM repeat protein